MQFIYTSIALKLSAINLLIKTKYKSQNTGKKQLKGYPVIAMFFGLLINFITQAATMLQIDQFPENLSKDCRAGKAKIYDECSSQSEILKAAIKRATETDKSVLVVYGSEWCIWCHVLEKYIQGGSGYFEYEWESEDTTERWPMQEKENKRAHIEAAVLNRYVARNFVVAHIEGTFSPDGIEVMASTGFDLSKIRAIPFIMVVDNKGQYVVRMQDYDLIEGLEIRSDNGEEYRGFNRLVLVKELLKLRKAAIQLPLL